MVRFILFKQSFRLSALALIGALGILPIAGCAASPAAPPAVTSPLSTPANGALQSPIPVVPTQKAGLGRATGKLMLQTAAGAEPQPGRLLYLAEIVTDGNGRETAVGYDRTSAPRTTTAPDGTFVFANVKPGRYGLIIDVVSQAFMLKEPTSGGNLLIDVKADVVTDFGTLVYQDLPR